MTAKNAKKGVKDEGPVLGTGAAGDPNDPGVRRPYSQDKTTDQPVDATSGPSEPATSRAAESGVESEPKDDK